MTEFVMKYKNGLTFVSFLFIVFGFVVGLIGIEMIKNSSLIIATVIAGIPIALKAFQSVRMKAFSIELLVTIAVIGALFIQEYTESSIVTFLFLFGDYLEARTLGKTRSSLKDLLEMAPQEATVIRDGGNEKIPVEEVMVGDRIAIYPGGRIPVDGKIINGHSSINEAAVTGESVPVLKREGDYVYSSTVADNGYIEIQAEKVGDDTTFAKIIELVEEAQNSKTKTEKFLTSFSTIYTPAIVILSILVLVITRDLHMAITFLVIACPGALVIGAPVSTVAGIGNGAKHGVLVKGGESIETFSKVDTIVFDKTGTLTKGTPEVTEMKRYIETEEEELLSLIAKAETISEHHLGQTIVKEASKRNIKQAKELKHGEVIKGQGIRAEVDGFSLLIGNRKLMTNENILLTLEMNDYAVECEKAGNTAIFVAINGEMACIVSIADQIREDALIALTQLRENGVKRFIMLTGDNTHTAHLVATELGLDEFHAELLPEDKVEYVKKLKNGGYIVAMAGDGLNDAPAIATAHIGIAMGKGGTDLSMETADVVLMADKLTQLSHAFSLSKATIRNMKQNTYFAVVTVFLLLYGVLAGSVHLASGMFIHEASVLLVILNGMKLIKFKSSLKYNQGHLPQIWSSSH